MAAPMPAAISGSFYEVLGVGLEASPEELRTAYRQRALQAHPDKTGGSSEAFLEIVRAFEALSNERTRAEYDRRLLREKGSYPCCQRRATRAAPPSARHSSSGGRTMGRGRGRTRRAPEAETGSSGDGSGAEDDLTGGVGARRGGNVERMRCQFWLGTGRSVRIHCPQRHVLYPFATYDGDFECDGCDRGQKPGRVMFGCRQCDYDLCVKCAERAWRAVPPELEGGATRGPAAWAEATAEAEEEAKLWADLTVHPPWVGTAPSARGPPQQGRWQQQIRGRAAPGGGQARQPARTTQPKVTPEETEEVHAWAAFAGEPPGAEAEAFRSQGPARQAAAEAEETRAAACFAAELGGPGEHDPDAEGAAEADEAHVGENLAAEPAGLGREDRRPQAQSQEAAAESEEAHAGARLAAESAGPGKKDSNQQESPQEVIEQAGAASPALELRRLLTEAKPQWKERELSVALEKLSKVEVCSPDELFAALRATGCRSLNKRLQAA
eukprot:CAMPEP_0175771286 /NCGR_PEP_ID=MMETSP0097-20121207/71945_1 /TAXON_ID=311494 /ORGANISM="Alexandrium monilatum, Strain CCMP3105" /LENGTH=496 /DNA_ID=CAMNT_0017081583 /DNA_START=1 /DNA_END=1487 /DNA_ORIENTATION=+